MGKNGKVEIIKAASLFTPEQKSELSGMIAAGVVAGLKAAKAPAREVPEGKYSSLTAALAPHRGPSKAEKDVGDKDGHNGSLKHAVNVVLSKGGKDTTLSFTASKWDKPVPGGVSNLRAKVQPMLDDGYTLKGVAKQ